MSDICVCDLVRTVEQDHSPTMLEYEGTIPSRYMVGTSQGHILCCSRKAKTQKEIILSKYSAHYSSVRAVQRNPIFPKSFLSAGDWSIKVWSEDLTVSPLLWVWAGQVRLTAATWSPARPSVIFASREDGCLLVLDILYKQDGPLLTFNAHDGALTSLAVHHTGSLLCLGPPSLLTPSGQF